MLPQCVPWKRSARVGLWLVIVLGLLALSIALVLWLTGHSVKNQATEKLRSPSPPTQDTEEVKQQNTLASSNQAAARRKLEQVVVAITRYSSRTGRLPNDVYSPDGRPLLSWRVVILPELGLEALHREFRFDEPWDGENNRKLLGRMPDVYALIGSLEEGKTLVQGLLGAAGDNPRPVFVSGDRAGLELMQVTDGTSNTLVCVEAAEAVEWTRPGGLPFTPQGPLPSLGRHFGNGTFVARLDGVVLWLPASDTAKFEAAVRALATTNGNERIELP